MQLGGVGEIRGEPFMIFDNSEEASGDDIRSYPIAAGVNSGQKPYSGCARILQRGAAYTP